MIGSHNSWTYSPPLKKWMYFLVPFTKCQSKTIKEQLDSGVVMLDLKVRLHNGQLCPSNGLYINNLDFEKDFKDPRIKYCRISLESRFPSSLEINKFVHLCKRLERCYPDIILMGGNNWYKPKKIYYWFMHKSVTFEKDYAYAYRNILPFKWSTKHPLKLQENKIVMRDFV